jgi:hypothetical protein
MTFDSTSKKNILSNDLLRYSIAGNLWEQLNPVGVYQITRSIAYWDGTHVTINIDYDKEIDKMTTVLQITKDSTSNGKFPIIGCSIL